MNAVTSNQYFTAFTNALKRKENMNKSILIIFMLCLVFAVGCPKKEEIEVRPLPPDSDVVYQPEPMPYPEPNPIHEPVHIPGPEDTNVAPGTPTYEQERYNEEVEEVARPARQSYTPEANHTPGEKTYLRVQIINFDDREELKGIRNLIFMASHGNYEIEEEVAPNLKSVYLKLWSDLSPINLRETLQNAFMNEGYDGDFKLKSDHLLVITPSW